MHAYIRGLGIIIAAFSVISFCQAFFDVGLSVIAQEMIGYYRTVTYFFLDFPARLFGVHFPAPLMDIWTLSFVGAGAYVRTPNIETCRFFRRNPNLTAWKYWKFPFGFFMGISGWGLLVLLAAISPTTYADALHEEPLDLSKGAALNVLYVIAAAITFFILNAYGPSV